MQIRNPLINKMRYTNDLRNVLEHTISGVIRASDLEGIERIRYRSFYMCDLLTEIYFPSTLRHIEEEAFFFCRSLSELILPEGLLTIGDLAFHSLSNLFHISIPSTCTTIGRGALQLTTVSSCVYDFYPAVPPSIQPDSFAFNNDDTVYVPKGCKTAYQNAPYWSEWADFIQERSE